MDPGSLVVCFSAFLWDAWYLYPYYGKSNNQLTIRLRARVFYEQIVNEAQQSQLSLVENSLFHQVQTWRAIRVMCTDSSLKESHVYNHASNYLAVVYE